jgi:hypothetical protein
MKIQETAHSCQFTPGVFQAAATNPRERMLCLFFGPLLCARLQIDEHALSPSGLPFGL